MEHYKNKINDYLNNIFIKQFPEPIIDKIKYFTEDGKRIRPILYLIFTNIENISGKDISHKTKIIYDLACVIEIIHNLSLILDDLPDMDNDLIRRNKPTFHLKFGINYTNYFVYYLFNKLGIILDYLLDYEINENNLNFIKDVKKIFQYNLKDLIDGQYIDLFWNNYLNNNLNNKLLYYDFEDEKEIIDDILDDINLENCSGNNLNNDSRYNFINNDITYSHLMKNINLNIKKTGSLFNISICVGFIMQLWINNINLKTCKEYNQIFQSLLNWSNIFGYMFQISDDILDIIPDNESKKPNICSIISIEKTKQLLKQGIKWLKLEIEILNKQLYKINKNIILNKELIDEIINLIENRIK